MSANKFKVGDKVRVRRDLVQDKCYDGVRCSSIMARMGGEVLTIDCVESDYYRVEENIFCWSDEMLEPAGKTLDNLCVGDFVREGHYIRKVLAAIDGCYLLSDFEDYNSTAAWYTVHDLKGFGYSIVEPTAPEPTIEIDGKKYRKADVEKAIKALELFIEKFGEPTVKED